MAQKMNRYPRNASDFLQQGNRSSRWLLFVTPDRIAYVGLLGSPGTRILGATTLYISLGSPFRLSQNGANTEEALFAIVPAYTPHHIQTPDRNIAEILIENESVTPEMVIAQLADTPGRIESTAKRVLDGFRYLQEKSSADSVPDLDALFFDTPLPQRKLDRRIAAVIERINANPAEKYPAELLADQVCLSFSRFTRLFCEQTGSTFRSFRAWKRARAVMHFFKRPSDNLLDAALDMGYADSTHFSHALRQFYGLSPRDMFAGARGVAVFEQNPVSMPAFAR